VHCILSPNDLAALEIAADLVARYGRAGLAERLRHISRAEPEPEPERAARKPTSEVEAIAQQVRALDDLGIFTIFEDAHAAFPSLLTLRVRGRAERAMRRRKR
jgi:hypothetical protein